MSQNLLAIGADHAGYDLKERLKTYLNDKGYSLQDCGTFSKEPVDYPQFAFAVARIVADGRAARGIMIDGAGIGSAMAANKVPGIRAAACYDVSTARNSREHNDANVLTLGAGLTGETLAQQIVDVWLTTECTAERHLRRAAMLTDIEKEKMTIPTSQTPNKTANETLPTELTDSDFQKIAERIQSMLRASGTTWPDIAFRYGECVVTCDGKDLQAHPEAVQHLLSLGVCRITCGSGGESIPRDVARYIDHTLLKPDATEEQIRKLCAEAKEYGFATVCINPTYVPLAAKLLQDTPVKVCTVTGFPLGTHAPEIKAMETRRAIREGAKEIDMVINIGALKSGDDELVYRDIAAVVDACRDGGALCKVIIEAALLTDEEKVRACQASKRARADFVKTSTGFGPGGATAHDVALMAQTVKGTSMGVKAAGGIRSFADAQEMLKAGATRIGASASIEIIKEATHQTES
ncbi:deoxyribose-phosphate aldolase [bacterium]|nr:deoxyribose-phosphate aldolase [bacterium]